MMALPEAAGLVILHVSQPVEAGVAHVVAGAAKYQVAAGAEVHIACPPGDLSHAAVGAGATWHRWHSTRDPGWRTLGEARDLHHLVRSIGPDVVHLHSSKAGLAGRLIPPSGAATLFQPHAWSFAATHGASSLAARLWERIAATRVDLLVACSRAELDEGRAAGVQGTAIIALNGVSPTRAVPAESRSRLLRMIGEDPASRALLVVCVGRLCEQKGQDVLLRAWPVVIGAVADARLIFIGDGPMLDQLADRACPTAHFIGAQPDASELVAGADLAAFPSRWEGLSLALIEAMAASRCIVATDVNGVRELLASTGDVGPAGAVVAPDDSDALAARLIELLVDAQAREFLGTNAWRRFAGTLTEAATYGVLTTAARVAVARRRERPAPGRRLIDLWQSTVREPQLAQGG